MRVIHVNRMSSWCPFQLSRLIETTLQKIAETFHDRHRHTYGHDNRAEPVQIVSVRLAAIGTIPPLVVRDRPARDRNGCGQIQTPALVP